MSPHFVQKVIACWEQQGERANEASSSEEGVTQRRRKKSVVQLGEWSGTVAMRMLQECQLRAANGTFNLPHSWLR
jgi:hypothetical protein